MGINGVVALIPKRPKKGRSPPPILSLGDFNRDWHTQLSHSIEGLFGAPSLGFLLRESPSFEGVAKDSFEAPNSQLHGVSFVVAGGLLPGHASMSLNGSDMLVSLSIPSG